jgi:hypothetical protein
MYLLITLLIYQAMLQVWSIYYSLYEIVFWVRDKIVSFFKNEYKPTI